jgi:hypothetical protein
LRARLTPVSAGRDRQDLYPALMPRSPLTCWELFCFSDVHSPIRLDKGGKVPPDSKPNLLCYLLIFPEAQFAGLFWCKGYQGVFQRHHGSSSPVISWKRYCNNDDAFRHATRDGLRVRSLSFPEIARGMRATQHDID